VVQQHPHPVVPCPRSPRSPRRRRRSPARVEVELQRRALSRRRSRVPSRWAW